MKDCIFCKIIKGEMPAKLVYKDGNLVVFHDINPKAPVHVLFVPVKHVESLRKVQGQDKELLGYMMLKVKDISEKLGIDQGYKVVINNGPLSGQLVNHLHLHLLGGWGKQVNWNV